MDLVAASFLCAAIIFAILVRVVRSALSPTIPVKGKTNVPAPHGLATLPILGNAWKFIGVSNVRDFHNIMLDIQAKCDRVTSFWLGLKLIICIADAKLTEIVLASSKANSKDPDLYVPVNKLADGVFSRNGEGWSDLRRPLNKFLHSKFVRENYYDVFAAKSDELCENIDKHCGQGTFEMLPYFHRCALHNVFETIMGIPDTHVEQLSKVFHFSNKITTLWFTWTVNPQYKLKWVFHFSTIKREMEELVERCRQAGQLIFRCRRYLLATIGKTPEDSEFEPECYTDVTMKVAIKENQNGYTMPIDVIAAGYDTSAVSLASACLFLAMHPEYQEKAYKEQLDIMGDTLRAPTYEEATKMTYLWMIYQETLRHVGSPAISRQLSSELIVDDYVLPEGASVYFILHSKRPDHWEKPTEFYPDHFLPENVAKRPRGAFLPFSTGARVCPGKSFAIIVSKITLSMLLRRFHFTTTLKFSEMDYNYMIMLESAKGYPVQVTRRTTVAS